MALKMAPLCKMSAGRDRKAMADILDVANYILMKQGCMSTMKLQKLCYYAQAWSLAWDDVELFPEEFEAWRDGPVCRRLFNVHKGVYMIEDMGCGNPDNLTCEQKETIDTVLATYGHKSGQWLSDLAHGEKPWKEARDLCNSTKASCDIIIYKEKMAEYYSSLING